MKAGNIILGIGAVLLSLAAALAQPSQALLTLTITPAPTEIKTGSEVTVNLTLTNVSDRDVTLEFTSPLGDYVTEVRDSTGKLVPDTEFKRKSSDPHGIHLKMSGRDIITHLKPGEAWKDRIPVSLSSDMLQPGQYSVQVMWRAPKEFGGGIVKSNTVTVTVKE